MLQLLAQVAPLDPWQAVIGGGGAVATLILFLYGFKSEWWVTGETHRRRIEQVKELQQRHDAYRDKVEDRILPLLHDAVNATRELADLQRMRRAPHMEVHSEQERQ